MIIVKKIYLARKPKRNQDAYTKLDFLPKQTELNNTNAEQDDLVRCDTKVGSKTMQIKEERKKLIVVD